MDELDHDLKRKQEARAGYINWRMRDVPSVYASLMPVSYSAAELFEAEKAIRQQWQADRQFAASEHAKSIGPRCEILDLTTLTSQQRTAFNMNVVERHYANELALVPSPGDIQNMRISSENQQNDLGDQSP